MATAILRRPHKIEQCAALMLTALKANQGVRMTRMDIESLVNVSDFSQSTRHGALNYLASQGHIKQESQYWLTGGGGKPTTYWTEVA